MNSRHSKERLRRTILPAALLFSNVALAEFDYSFVEASYSQNEANVESSAVDDTTGNGYGVKLGYAIGNNIAVGGFYETISADTTANFQQGGRLDVTSDGASIGGYGLFHAPLNSQIDYFVGGLYRQVDIETTGPSGVVPELTNDSDTTYVFAGARIQLIEQIELEGKVEYDLGAEDNEDEIGFVLEGRFMLQPSLAIGGYYSPDDSGDTLKVSLRKSFW